MFSLFHIIAWDQLQQLVVHPAGAVTGLIIFTILGSPASVKVGTILGVIHLLYLDYMKYLQKQLSTMLRSLLRVKAIVEAIECINLLIAWPEPVKLVVFLVLLTIFIPVVGKTLSRNTKLKEHLRSYQNSQLLWPYPLSQCFTLISCVVVFLLTCIT